MAQEADQVTNYLQWARRPRSAIWLHLLAVVLMFLLWQVTQGLLMILVNNGFGKDSAQAAALLPITFAAPVLALLLLVRVLFGRPVWRVALPAWPPRWSDYFVALLIGWIALALAYVVLSPWLDVSYRGWNSAVEVNVTLLVVLVAGLVVQTGLEELYFRGLLMQATYRIVRWAPVVIGLQALFFAQLHIGNITALGSGWTAMLPYLISATAFGYVAWRTGSLLMPMGLHMANNSFIVLGVGVEGDVIAGPAPWVAVPSTGTTILFASVLWPLAVVLVEVVLRRRRRASQPQRPDVGATR